MKAIVTGAAGFIGSHVAQVLLAHGEQVIGFDNLNDYYDPALKRARLDRLLALPGYTHVTADLADRAAVEYVFAKYKPERVVHLAAQAGVRYAAENPHVYVSSNVTGFLHILEGCRHHGVEHLVYASTSSVYGANLKMPFSEHSPTEHPLTLYAATKKANEQMAHSYAHLYGIPCTGLRFFTVYGPWGRPDMSPWLFTSAILEGRTIDVFNHGDMMRDFTYIDDIADGTVRVLDRIPQGNPDFDHDAPDPASSHAPYRVYNIGNHTPVQLMDFIGTIEKALGQEAKKNFLPMQDGDVKTTYADVDDLIRDTGFKPATSLEYGIGKWVEWYRAYKGLD